MTEQHLLDFVRRKLERAPDDVVRVQNGIPQTLAEVFAALGLDAARLYAPLCPELEEIFLRIDNYNHGKYFAELINEVLDVNDREDEDEDYKEEENDDACKTSEASQEETAEFLKAIPENMEKCGGRVWTEMRVAVSGSGADEWERLAKWVAQHSVGRGRRNRWVVELPRGYSAMRAANPTSVRSYADYLDNVFAPLVAATTDPGAHPALAALLAHISGFDLGGFDADARVAGACFSDAGTALPGPTLPEPEAWTGTSEPPYVYSLYHYYVCVARLNALRRARGHAALALRPHCGETGGAAHLAAGFLLAGGVGHGLALAGAPVLQYLYYLCYVPVAMSPLSNNRLLPSYSANPFPRLFQRGLPVALATDAPLRHHYTQTPLAEEYAIAARVWNLTDVDLAELAKNSVLHCGFPRAARARCYGPLGAVPGMACNDPHRTNVPLIRTHFRSHCFEAEVRLLFELARDAYAAHVPRVCAARPRPNCGVLQYIDSELDLPMLPPSVVSVVGGHDAADDSSKATASKTSATTKVTEQQRQQQQQPENSNSSLSRMLKFKEGVSDLGDQGAFMGIHIHNSALQGQALSNNSEVEDARRLVREAVALRRKHAATWFDRDSATRSRPRPRTPAQRAYTERLAGGGEDITDSTESSTSSSSPGTSIPNPSTSPNPSNTNFSRHVYKETDGVFIVYDSHEVFCANDGRELATVYCTVCGRDYCAECAEVLHQSALRRTHRRVVHAPAAPLYRPVAFAEYAADVGRVSEICASGPVCTMCWHRNHMLEERFNFHVLLNGELEEAAARRSGADVHRAVKVDNHVHANRSMPSEALLGFIARALAAEPDTVVLRAYGKQQRSVTLAELFALLGLAPRALTLCAQGTRAGAETFRRFDVWIHKCEPFGQQALKDVFLGTTANAVDGRYLARLLHECTLARLAASPALRLELRVSVCGAPGDPARVARWATRWGLVRRAGNRWLVQVPRIYPAQRAAGTVRSFGDFLANIFAPLFEVTKDPSTDRALHEFLLDVSGFDCVGDEHVPDRAPAPLAALPPPARWTSAAQPPYAYYLYYLNANIQSLNNFRLLTGRNVFDFRPHCGETGDVAHLAAAYLAAKSIAHGTQLRDNPALSYLYYINQIGITASPLSETAVHILVRDNPFPVFFRRGLNVSLSTDNPLMVHMTSEPVVEEYATAAQMWRLSPTDLCEIARNSVLQSGFSLAEKEAWLGPGFARTDLRDHDVARTNVPLVRLRFRFDAFFDELRFLFQSGPSPSPSPSAATTHKETADSPASFI